MNAEVKAKWVAALRSGKFEQGRTALAFQTDDGATQYCCLGVLCEVLGVDKQPTRIDGRYGFFVAEDRPRERHYLPPAVAQAAGLDSTDPEVNESCNGRNPVSLSYLNDKGYTFEQIAQLIETQL